MELLIFFYLIGCILVGLFWGSKGHRFFPGFITSLFLSPIVAFVIGLVVKGNPKVAEDQAIQRGEQKRCPYCAEMIKPEAIVCRFCGRDLPA